MHQFVVMAIASLVIFVKLTEGRFVPNILKQLPPWVIKKLDIHAFVNSVRKESQFLHVLQKFLSLYSNSPSFESFLEKKDKAGR